MVSTLKEKPSGGFYCAECRMSVAEPVETCPFCGSVISNYEAILEENHAPDIIIGGRWWEPYEEFKPEEIALWKTLEDCLRRDKE